MSRDQKSTDVRGPQIEYSSAISMHRLVTAIWHQRSIAIAVFFLVFLPFVSVAFLSAPIYRAETVVSPVSADSGGGIAGALAGQLGGLSSLVGLNLTGKDEERTNLAVLRSRELAEEMIVEEDLFRVIYENNWDSEGQRWTGKFDTDPPSLRRAFKVFDEDIRAIIENRRDGLVTVRMEISDRVIAAELANGYVQRANNTLRRKAIEDANNILAYLNAELEKTSSIEVRQSLFRLIEMQLETMSIANAREEYAFEVVDRAVVMDADMFVWPNRLLLVIVGLFVSGLFSIAVIALRLK